MRLTFSTLLALFVCLLAGCEKEEQPLQLPPSEVVAGSITDRVDMGPTYATQVFYNFQIGGATSSSAVDGWDLAFESSADGMRVYMNGGAKEGGTAGNVAVYNTGFRNFANVTALPAGFNASQWSFDHPGGNRDSTGVGEWRNLTTAASKQDVYIIRTGAGGGQPTHKLQILSATGQKWTIAVGLIGAAQPHVVDLPKDTTRNFIYYNLRDGAVVTPEPAKAAWDVVFTRYRYLYPELNNFPYIVTGVLLNPAGVSVAVDSTTMWDNVIASHAAGLTYTAARDGIGWNWKTIDFLNNGRYEVNPKKIFVVRTRTGKLFKLRFLDFYAPNGDKGSPTFEYRQIQ